MMVQRFIAVLLLVTLVGLVRAEDVKVVASAEELKGIKAKKIIWKKDSYNDIRSFFIFTSLYYCAYKSTSKKDIKYISKRKIKSIRT